MAILILNRLSNQNLPYTEILKDINEEKLLLCASNRSKGFNKIDYDYFETFDNYDSNSNVEYQALKLSEKYNITNVIATSEYDLIRAAAIREQLNLPGQNFKSAIAFRDKIIMKSIAKDYVLVPKNERITSIIDILNFIKDNGYPFVIKPVDGAGSIETYIIKSEDQLQKFLSKGIRVGYEIEEYIDGDMYTIDGLYLNGILELFWCGMYVNDCLSFQEGKQASNVQIDENHILYARLESFIKKLVKGMPFPRTTTFHCEVFHTRKNELFLCEIASRTGGGGINELGQCYANINLNHVWVKGQCNLISFKELGVKIENKKLFGWLQIPPKNGVLEYIPREDSIPFSWIENYTIKAVEGTSFNSASKSSHKIAIAVVSGDSLEEIKHRMSLFTDWIIEKCIWKMKECELLK